jgi:hypothetical protein
MTVDIGNRAVLDQEEGAGQLVIDKSKASGKEAKQKAAEIAAEQAQIGAQADIFDLDALIGNTGSQSTPDPAA